LIVTRTRLSVSFSVTAALISRADPAASSGTNGSGIELRYVDYRGKRLLYRAHVPILNVRYDQNACGPYRDWQNEEGMLQAPGTDVVPGFRLCTSPATTILDTGSDAGNCLGVAIYVQGQEVVLVSEMQAGAEDAPVIKLVYSILAQAVGELASDIHLEPEEGELRIRFRIDGVLKEAAHVPRRMTGAVISRLKIMSELDIAEKRVPQDGRVSVSVDERRIDLRVTTLPTQRGEGATIRILDESNAHRSLDELGMDGSARVRFESSFRQAYGAILVTGPTGSGKSTTLYAALSELNEIAKKIITIEDPVEYRIDGINQMNVNRKAGLDFARGLRSILRADPDIVMVGEIRDSETARIAVEAALTGHMMLTTLHTNDAPGAIARLGEMGIEPFLTASAVDCVVAQRLARKLCPHCKRRAVIPTLALLEAGVRVGAEIEAYEPLGCARCNQTGYRGRVGIFSAMELSDQLKEMAIARAAETDIGAVAREEGMLTLREDGVAKVRSGLTSLEEVLRVTA